LDENERRASELIANFEMDSFAALRRVIAKAVAEKQKNGGSVYYAKKFGAFEAARNVMRSAKIWDKAARDAGRVDKFAPFEPAQIEARLDDVQKLVGAKLKHRVISDELLVIENS
jgi:hypothetical protein